MERAMTMKKSTELTDLQRLILNSVSEWETKRGHLEIGSDGKRITRVEGYLAIGKKQKRRIVIYLDKRYIT